MASRTQLGMTPKDQFLQAARIEMAAFEQREREFRLKDREERAADLLLPFGNNAPNKAS